MHVHERSHTEEKPYQCKTCDKPAECRTLLCNEDEEFNDSDKSIVKEPSSHEVSHAGKFTCWICQEELSSASQLSEHYDDHMK